MTKLNVLVIILSSLSFAYSLFHIGDSLFSYIYILPLLVVLLSIVFSNIYYSYSKSIVFHIYILQVIMRYCILPALLSRGENFSVGYRSINLNLSITIMVIELLATFIVLFLFSYKQSNAYENRIVYIKTIKSYLVTSLILITIFIYMYTTNAFEQINPIWQLQQYVDDYITNQNELLIDGYGVILYQPFKVIASLLLISLIYNSRYISNKKKKWAYLMIIVTSSLFITGISRFNIILSSLPLLVLIIHLLDKKDSKLVLTLTTISLSVVLMVTSIAKFSRYGNTASAESLINADSINAYFAGPGNIANGLDAFASIKPNALLFFINDTIQNIPLLAQFTSVKYTLTSAFNNQYYGHQLWADQIVPLSISGLFHFSIFGIFIYSALFLAIALSFERLSYKTINIGYKYIFISLSVSLSLIFMSLLSSYYAFIARTFLFLFIPIFIVTNLPKFKYK